MQLLWQQIRVQAHSCRQSKRQVRDHAHQYAGDGGSQGCGGKDGAGIHAGSAQDAGIHGQDVSHGQESCETSDDLCAHVGAVLFEFENFLHLH